MSMDASLALLQRIRGDYGQRTWGHLGWRTDRVFCVIVRLPSPCGWPPPLRFDSVAEYERYQAGQPREGKV